MHSRLPAPPALGAGNYLASGAPAYADQGVEHSRTVGDGSPSNEDLRPEATPEQGTSNLQGQQPGSSSQPRHRRGASSQTNDSSFQPIYIGEFFQTGSRVDWRAVFNAWLKVAGEEIQTIDSLVDIISWIARSDFLRLQQPEPEVGHPAAIYPTPVEKYGIKGLSIYTSLFHNFDMETYTCKLCLHIVQENLEDAIAHQRAHFHHYPYQCSPTHTNCGQQFASEAILGEHQLKYGH